MKNKFKRTEIMIKKIKVYCLSAVVLTFILTVLRCLSLFFAYDTSVGYFDRTFLSGFTTALFVIGALWCLSPLVLIPRESITSEFSPDTVSFKAMSAYSALVTLLASFAMITAGDTRLIEKIGIITTVLSTLFFVFGILKKDIFRTVRAFLSIVTVSSFVCILASVYFDMTIAMNSPHKIMGGFALMSAMIFGLCETRIYMQKDMPRLHFALGLLTLMLGFPYAGSSIFYRLISDSSEFVTNATVLGNIGYVYAIMAISVYAAARCYHFREAIKKNDAKLTEENRQETSAVNTASEKQDGV